MERTTAELSNDRLLVSDGLCTQYCTEKKTRGRKRKCPPASACVSPPLLDLNREHILPKCWEFVRRAEAIEGRALAPLTGSVLEVTPPVKRAPFIL